jgi:hypothetical protein
MSITIDEKVNTSLAKNQPIFVSYDNDYGWVIELPIKIDGSNVQYEYASAHTNLPIPDHAQTLEEAAGMAFRTKQDAVSAAKSIALEYGMSLKILPRDKVLQPTEKQKKALAEAAFLKRMKKGDVILVINAWWAMFGSVPTWKTSKNKRSKQKPITEEESKIGKRLEKQGVIVRTITSYNSAGVWESQEIGLPKREEITK